MILPTADFGTTACKWDSIIPLDKMWEQLKRIIKPNRAIALFGAEPFSSLLRVSNLKDYKYDWVWDKKQGANFAQANKRPLKNFENILVYYDKPALYNPQRTDNPKGIEKRSSTKLSRQKKGNVEQVSTTNQYSFYSENYDPTKLLPKAIIQFQRETRPIHPTQKPVPLMEYLIKTYTNEGDTVLDFTMGSGTTGAACVNTNRDFIGIEKDEGYFKIAKDRIETAKQKMYNA